MLGVRIPVSVISDGLRRNWLIGRADQLTVLCLPGRQKWWCWLHTVNYATCQLLSICYAFLYHYVISCCYLVPPLKFFSRASAEIDESQLHSLIT